MWPSVIPNEQVTVAPEPSEQYEDALCMKEGCDVALPSVHPLPLGQSEAPVHVHASDAGKTWRQYAFDHQLSQNFPSLTSQTPARLSE